MTLKRTLSTTLKQVVQSFPILLITGPRQVGKTTLLETCSEAGRNYVTLDDLDERALAQSDPALFFQMHKPPVIIDEIQYAPQLFSQIKLIADKEKKNGLFWLTGSQKFHLMQHVSESLAGRVAILDLLGLSQKEISQSNITEPLPFSTKPEWLEQARNSEHLSSDIEAVYGRIWRGSFPKLHVDKNMSRDIFYKSYVQTYIQRDVKDILHITDDTAFVRFLRVIAARTGQLLNYSDVGRDAEIDHKTVKAWLSILETSGLVYLLQPYHSNLTKRVVKTPKLYFLDTGLCTYLSQWPSAQSLATSNMAGPLLETYIFSEILKSYWHIGKSAHFYFYRDSDKKEIDLLIEEGDTLYPMEFKRTATPSRDATKHFSCIKKLKKTIGPGAVICLKPDPVALSQDAMAVPVGWV